VDPPYFTGYVAETAGKKPSEVIGLALYHLKYSTWEGPVMHLNTLVVSEKCRRQGVGTKMMKQLAKVPNPEYLSSKKAKIVRS
jgi:ribosomal protein S18 acetylase RimI-like enzyme